MSDATLRFRLYMLLLVLGMSTSPCGSEEPVDRQKFRFGIGFAYLANERCPGIRYGPMFHQLIRILRVGAKSQKKNFDEAAFLKAVGLEADDLIKKTGKDLCASAREIAKLGEVLELAP